MLTVDIDDREGPEGEASPAAELPSHQLDNLCDLIVALFQIVLAGTWGWGGWEGNNWLDWVLLW